MTRMDGAHVPPHAALTYQLLVAQVHGQVAQGSGCSFHHTLAVVAQEVGDGGEPLLLAQCRTDAAPVLWGRGTAHRVTRAGTAPPLRGTPPGAFPPPSSWEPRVLASPTVRLQRSHSCPKAPPQQASQAASQMVFPTTSKECMSRICAAAPILIPCPQHTEGKEWQ